MKWILNPFDYESVSDFLDKYNSGKDIKIAHGNICLIECNRKDKFIKNKK